MELVFSIVVSVIWILVCSFLLTTFLNQHMHDKPFKSPTKRILMGIILLLASIALLVPFVLVIQLLSSITDHAVGASIPFTTVWTMYVGRMLAKRIESKNDPFDPFDILFIGGFMISAAFLYLAAVFIPIVSLFS